MISHTGPGSVNRCKDYRASFTKILKIRLPGSLCQITTVINLNCLSSEKCHFNDSVWHALTKKRQIKALNCCKWSLKLNKMTHRQIRLPLKALLGWSKTSDGQMTRLLYFSESVDTPAQILLQYKRKLFGQVFTCVKALIWQYLRVKSTVCLMSTGYCVVATVDLKKWTTETTQWSPALLMEPVE